MVAAMVDRGVFTPDDALEYLEAAVRDATCPLETHLQRGDVDALRQQLSDAETFVEEGGLDYRFKTIFGRSSASAEDIETLLEFLQRHQT